MKVTLKTYLPQNGPVGPAYAGQTVHLPDDLAGKLIEAGNAEEVPDGAGADRPDAAPGDAARPGQ